VVRLPAKTTSFKSWTEHLERLGPQLFASEADYWRERLTPDVVSLPLDGLRPPKTDMPATFAVSTSFTAEETTGLHDIVQRECDATLEEILLTALAEAVARWSGKRQTAVTLLHHGRDRVFDGVDVSRTVGWFTTEYPVTLDIEGAQGVRAALDAVKEQVRGVPRHGIGYGILRYVGPDALAGCAPPRIMLNHTGVRVAPTDGPMRLVYIDRRMPALKHLNSVDAPIQVMTGIRDDVLEVEWTSNENVVQESTAATLAETMTGVLRELISACGARE
jgi:non-ribosomal peptide synthase protein (TIGR01720 family)